LGTPVGSEKGGGSHREARKRGPAPSDDVANARIRRPATIPPREDDSAANRLAGGAGLLAYLVRNTKTENRTGRRRFFSKILGTARARNPTPLGRFLQNGRFGIRLDEDRRNTQQIANKGLPKSPACFLDFLGFAPTY
jgi:hypothetical protein